MKSQCILHSPPPPPPLPSHLLYCLRMLGHVYGISSRSPRTNVQYNGVICLSFLTLNKPVSEVIEPLH